jgi:hypothetical protein
MTIIPVMIEAANTPETSVKFYRTARRSIPEDGHLWLKKSVLRKVSYRSGEFPIAQKR